MEVSSISWIKFLGKKYIRYVYLVLLVISFSFPVNPPHSTSNFIDILGLPDIAYPISYVMIGIFLILLISKFSVPKVEKKKIHFDHSTKSLIQNDEKINLNGLKYSLVKRTSGSTLDKKNIWTIKIEKPNKMHLDVLLNYEEKQRLEAVLQGFKN